METLTMAQALRHMAERAEAGDINPWNDLEYQLPSGKWHAFTYMDAVHNFADLPLRIKPQPKLVNGVECWPHRGELVLGQEYFIPSPGSEIGFYGIKCSNTNDPHFRLILKRGCVYTTKEGALIEAKAQGWV